MQYVSHVERIAASVPYWKGDKVSAPRALSRHDVARHTNLEHGLPQQRSVLRATPPVSTKRAAAPLFVFTEWERAFLRTTRATTTTVKRAAPSFPPPKVRGAGRWPRIDAWFEAFEERAPYYASRSDWYVPTRALSLDTYL